MINSANKVIISSIFSPDTNIKYCIPKYQREYSWGKENWDEFLDDIEEIEEGHFVGSIICIYSQLNPHQIPEYEIIDGQQRLTTISLLYAAIYQALQKFNLEKDENLILALGNLKFRLIQPGNLSETKIELSSQNNNFEDYKSILKEIGIIANNEDIPNKGNRQIYRAYRHFGQRLSVYKKAELLKLLKQINNVVLVRIEVDSASSAFMLFESLNDRGIPLTAVDLIKNKMLAEVDKQDQSIDDAFERWKNIIKNLPSYPIQERFLRQYYNAFKWKPEVRIEGIPKATRSTLIKIYEKLIKRKLDFIFNDLYDKSVVYNKFINIAKDKIFYQELRDLEQVKAAPSYTLLLYLFSQNNLGNSDLLNVIKSLVKYFIRRNTTDFPNTRNLDQIFIDLIEELESKSEFTYKFISQYLFHKDRFSDLKSFKEKLNSDLYTLNVDATRFILAKIEEKYSGTREHQRDFWEKDRNGKLIWTIEHILPEGYHLPAAWVKMIANGDKTRAQEIQQRLIHKLGNLTLTGYNQNLSNFDFVKKRDRKDNQGRFIGYKNGLFLNKKLAKKNNWDADDIEMRTVELINSAITIFKVEGE